MKLLILTTSEKEIYLRLNTLINLSKIDLMVSNRVVVIFG